MVWRMYHGLGQSPFIWPTGQLVVCHCFSLGLKYRTVVCDRSLYQSPDELQTFFLKWKSSLKWNFSKKTEGSCVLHGRSGQIQELCSTTKLNAVKYLIKASYWTAVIKSAGEGTVCWVLASAVVLRVSDQWVCAVRRSCAWRCYAGHLLQEASAGLLAVNFATSACEINLTVRYFETVESVPFSSLPTKLCYLVFVRVNCCCDSYQNDTFLISSLLEWFLH